MRLRPTYKGNVQESDFPGKGSRLVYGTSGLGGVWGKIDPEESIACLHYAFENGIIAIDTAPSYSQAERIVGRALNRWPGERPFISTKVGRLQAEGAYEFKLDYSPEGMRSSVERSLDLLGIEQLDLLFLHEPQCVPMHRIDEVLETMQGFKEQGLTRMLGVGGNPTDEFRPYITPSTFQVVSGFCKLDACNLTAFDQDIPYLRQQGIAYYAASSLHFSLLGDGFDAYVSNPPDSEYISARDVAHAKSVNALALKYDMPLSTLAQRYLFSIEEATRVVIGARTLNHIQITISDWEQGTLPETIFNEVTNLLEH